MSLAEITLEKRLPVVSYATVYGVTTFTSEQIVIMVYYLLAPSNNMCKTDVSLLK